MEIVVRALVLFLFLWGVTRVTGKATLGELSTFQLVLYVTMGDLIQQGVTQQDYSVTGAVLAISVFAVLTVALSYINWRFPRARPLVHGGPAVLVSRGEPRMEVLEAERISLDDLYEAAREQGLARLADVGVAVLEPDGRISFFRSAGGGDGADADDGSAQPPPAGQD